MKNNKKIYIKIIGILESSRMTRKEIISAYISSLGLTREQMADRSTNGRLNIERSIVGAAINDMRDKGMILRGDDGLYHPAEQKPVIIRNEKIASEILKMLDGSSLTKTQIRSNLTRSFGTDKTITEKDDNKLAAYASDTLRRMVNDGAVIQNGKYYSLSQKIYGKLDDINSMLSLKASYLTRLHKKGGEFFEHYFMVLLEKYISSRGKTVITNTITGGAADGGIDGIMQTVDCLGFRETIMVQTKNRSDTTNETTVRGFYGAVCAKQGSRGIFVTLSDFHPAAAAFLNSIDNCVGVDGDMLFKMALDTHYGIKKCGTEITVDDKIL